MALLSVSPIPSLLHSSNGSSLTQPPPLLQWQLSHSASAAQEHQHVHPLLSPLEPLKNTSLCILYSHHSNRATAVDAAASSHHSASKVSLQTSNLSYSLFTDPSDQATRKAPIHSLDLTLENHQSTRLWLHLFFVWGLVYYGNWVVLLVNFFHFI